MKKEADSKFRNIIITICIIFFFLFILFEWFDIESISLLLIVTAILTWYYLTRIVIIFKSFFKTRRLFLYKILDLLFNATFFYFLFLGLYFGSKSEYFSLFSDKNLMLNIIKYFLILMAIFFYSKKAFIHIPLEYNLLKGKDYKSQKNFLNDSIYLNRSFYLIVTIILLLVILLLNPYQYIDFSNLGTLFIIIFIMPLILFIFATYLDLVSFLNKKYTFFLRFCVHIFDLYSLFSISFLSLKIVIPNLAINQSLTIPFLIIFPFIYLMHHVREIILGLNIKISNKK